MTPKRLKPLMRRSVVSHWKQTLVGEAWSSFNEAVPLGDGISIRQTRRPHSA